MKMFFGDFPGIPFLLLLGALSLSACGKEGAVSEEQVSYISHPTPTCPSGQTKITKTKTQIAQEFICGN